MAARRGPGLRPSAVVTRGDVATHIDANILPVLVRNFGRRSAAVFRHYTEDIEMACKAQN